MVLDPSPPPLLIPLSSTSLSHFSHTSLSYLSLDKRKISTRERYLFKEVKIRKTLSLPPEDINKRKIPLCINLYTACLAGM